MLAILLVDDEPMIRLPVGDALVSRGHDVTLASDGARALACLEARAFDVVVSDVRLPKADGFAILGHVRANAPATDVLLLSAYGTVDETMAALGDDAPGYMTKPFDVEELAVRVAHIEARRRAARELAYARQALVGARPEASMVGASSAMTSLRDRMAVMAESEGGALSTGERGTGKALAARELHGRSARRHESLLRVRCAKGEGAAALSKLSRDATAGGGRRAIYVEDVDALPPVAQDALAALLAEKTPMAVIASTARDVRALASEGRFRGDVVQALAAREVAIPPLRDRAGDVRRLATHFVRVHAHRFDGGRLTLTDEAEAALADYAFPGNVRELARAVEHAVVRASGAAKLGPIALAHLPATLRGTP